MNLESGAEKTAMPLPVVCLLFLVGRSLCSKLLEQRGPWCNVSFLGLASTLPLRSLSHHTFGTGVTPCVIKLDDMIGLIDPSRFSYFSCLETFNRGPHLSQSTMTSEKSNSAGESLKKSFLIITHKGQWENFLPSLMTQVQCPGPKWWKERPDSYRLFSDPHMHTVAWVYI